MPELPEIEVVRRSLLPALVGAQLRVIQLGPHDMRARGKGRSAGGAPGRWMPAQELLHGGSVAALHRCGKQLAIEASDGRALAIQLGMSGQLRLVRSGDMDVPGSHRHIEWAVDSRRGPALRLVFRDPRRFGGVHAAASMRALREGAWGKLGPDALRVTARQLAAALRGARPVKAALLDQCALAGVGNIYADEALFRAGIRPTAPARRIAPEQCVHLARAIRAVLRQGLAFGGSTLRDHRSATGERGAAQALHAVYGRGGEPCTQCATTLRSLRVAGRATVFCPVCQDARRA